MSKVYTKKYTTKYMQLELPIPGVTPGPDWAMMINEVFWKIDQHDHSGPGMGRRIQSTSIIMGGDIDFGEDNYFGINNLKYMHLSDISSNEGTPARAGALFNYRGDLWWQYNSTGGTSGAFCQITSYDEVVSVTSAFEPIHIYEPTYFISSMEKISAIFVTSQPTTITLPYAVNVGSGKYYLIQDRGGNASTNNITIAPQSTDSIGTSTAGTNATISTNYGHKWLIADGSNNRWLILTEA